jgi:hypothetical protein
LRVTGVKTGRAWHTSSTRGTHQLSLRKASDGVGVMKKCVTSPAKSVPGDSSEQFRPGPNCSTPFSTELF